MDHAGRLREAAKEYDRAVSEAIDRRNAAIIAAAEAGMTRRAIAAEVGLSFARVQQIIRGA